MNRSFLLNITFLIVINVIIKPVYILAIEVNVQNAVGLETYGIYFSIFNFCFLFQIINDLGIQNFNSRNIAQNPKSLPYNLKHILGTKLILSLIFLIIIFSSAFIMGYDKALFELLFLVAINQIILSFLLYLRTNIAASGHYMVDSIISAVDKFLLIFILAYLLWFIPDNEFQIEWFVLAQTASLIISCMVALIYNRKLVEQLTIKLSSVFSKDLLKKSYPFAVIIFLMIAYTRMDGIMLERMLDDDGEAAGVYAAGFRLLEASNMIGFLFATLLLPMFSSLLKDRLELSKLVKTSFSLIFSISVIACMCCVFFGFEIMSFLYPEFSNNDFGLLLAYLMITFVAMSAGYIFGTLLTASGKLRLLNIVFIIGIIINFSLNWYLIPRHQFLGAAIATIVTQYFVLTGQVIIVKRAFNFSVKAKTFGVHLLFLLVVLGIFGGIKGMFLMVWPLKIIIGIILAFIISLVFKLIDLRNFRESFSS